VLVDGVTAAAWTVAATGGKRNRAAALTVRTVRPLPAADRDAVTAEGLALLDFLEPAAAHDVRIEPA
jgi:hypothetical protein